MRVIGFVSQVEVLPPQKEGQSGLATIFVEGAMILARADSIRKGLAAGAEIDASVNCQWKDKQGVKVPQFWLQGYNLLAPGASVADSLPASVPA